LKAPKKTQLAAKNARPRLWKHWCKDKFCQVRYEVRRCSEQETSFALSCSKLRSHGRKYTLLKKVLVTFMELLGSTAVNGRLGNYVPLHPSLRLRVWYCYETIRLYQRWEMSDYAFHGNAITINHAERAFPSCVETTARWRRFSKSLWRDVNQLCSSAKPQPFKYVWKMFSASRRKYTTGKYGTGLNGRGKLSKLRKMSLEMEAT